MSIAASVWGASCTAVNCFTKAPLSAFSAVTDGRPVVLDRRQEVFNESLMSSKVSQSRTGDVELWSPPEPIGPIIKIVPLCASCEASKSSKG